MLVLSGTAGAVALRPRTCSLECVPVSVVMAVGCNSGAEDVDTVFDARVAAKSPPNIKIAAAINKVEQILTVRSIFLSTVNPEYL